MARTGTLGLLAMLVVACGGGGGGPGIGTVRVSLTDAPSLDYDEVWVTVERVRLHRDDTAPDGATGWIELPLSPARRIDLLQLQNGLVDALGQGTLPAGRYTQVRLVLSGAPGANQVLVRGETVLRNLTTPSAQQSGLKLIHPFDVGDGQLVDLLLDFDASRSVVRAGNSGQYILKPVIRVLPVAGAARVTGSLPLADAALGATASLQRFDPVTGTVDVARATVVDRASGQFTLAPVAPGQYALVVVIPGRATQVVQAVALTPAQVLALSPLPAAPPSATRTITGHADAAADRRLRPGPAARSRRGRHRRRPPRRGRVRQRQLHERGVRAVGTRGAGARVCRPDGAGHGRRRCQRRAVRAAGLA